MIPQGQLAFSGHVKRLYQATARISTPSVVQARGRIQGELTSVWSFLIRLMRNWNICPDLNNFVLSGHQNPINGSSSHQDMRRYLRGNNVFETHIT